MSEAFAVPRRGSTLADVAARLAAYCEDPGLRARLDAVVVDLAAEPPSPALDRVGEGFDLSAFERDLLVLVGLPEEHESFARLARLLHPLGEPWLCAAAVALALHLDARGRRHLRAALDAGPLHRHGLVVIDRKGPLPEGGMRLATGLWSVLRGHDHWPPGIRPHDVARVATPALTPARLRTAIGSGRRVVVVTGAGRPAEELAALVAGAAAAADLPTTTVDAELPARDPALHLGALAVARGSLPVLVGRPASPPLADHPGPVLVCCDDPAGVPLDARPLVLVDVGSRRLGESVGMWESLAPELDGGSAVLASVLRVDHVRAARAVADARVSAGADVVPLSVESVIGHARHRAGSDLPASARLVRPTGSWDDVVTTPDNAVLLRSIVERVRGQVRVLHEWGFDARATRGVRALLSGPPGTGKTLSAHVVAAALGLDLLVVDVSALVSKWLGETEKNISEVFDAAERAQAVLFFDEADAVFGRRTDGGDAQARWANLETAHLLARIDAFEGLVLLATNLRGNIDDAFVRRLDVIVEFDEPGDEERRRLWAAHLPASAPVAADVDLDQLSAVYQITGGLIRNAALTAAFRAAADERLIDQQTLLDAVAQEYRKAGRSFPGMPRGRAPLSPGGT